MRFFSSLAGATVLLSSARLGSAEDCTNGPFQKVRGFPNKDFVGTDADRCETKWSEGLVINGVEVWANAWHVKAIQFTYDDGSVGAMIGTPDGDRHDKITWAKDIPIDEFVLWGNYEADALGKVKIVVDGKTLEQGSDVGSSPGDLIERRTGVLLGGAVSAGGKVDKFWPMMLSDKIGTVTITDIVLAEDLDSWNQQRKGIDTIDFKGAVANNPSPLGTPPQTFSMKKAIMRTTSTTTTWHHQNAISLGAKAEYKGKIGMPILTQETTISGDVKYERTWFDEGSGTDRITDTFEWTHAGQIPPQRSVACTITSLRGKFNSSFSAKVTIQLTDPNVSYDISMQGTWESIGWARVVSDCKEGPLGDSAEATDAEVFDITKAAGALGITLGAADEVSTAALTLQSFMDQKTSRRWVA